MKRGSLCRNRDEKGVGGKQDYNNTKANLLPDFFVVGAGRNWQNCEVKGGKKTQINKIALYFWSKLIYPTVLTGGEKNQMCPQKQKNSLLLPEKAGIVKEEK